MSYDLAIVGGGPGGYVAALRAAQLGLQTVLVEKNRVGGTCLNVGCIPTKALMTAAHLAYELRRSEKYGIKVKDYEVNWDSVKSFMKDTVEKLVTGVEYLLKNRGVVVVKGEAFFDEKGILKVNGEEIQAKNIIIASGSRPSSLPGMEFDGEKVLDSTTLIYGKRIPSSLVVLGAGAVGLELALAFSLLGSEVTVIEIMDTVLPGIDRDMAILLERHLKKAGLKVFTSTKVTDFEKGDYGVKLKAQRKEQEFTLEAEILLLAVGRKPNSENFSQYLTVNEKGFIKVDEKFKTSREGVFAIGDVIGGKLLAHKASHEAIALVEHLAGKPFKKPMALPLAVFTIPEYASVGITETEAKAKKLQIKKGRFPLSANGRALSLLEPEGVVKVITDMEGKLLGVHILAPSASEFIAEATLAVEKGLKAHELADSIHIHPTVSEALMEACAAIDRKAIHVLTK